MKKIYASCMILFCIWGLNANAQFSQDIEIKLPGQPNVQKAIFGKFAGSESDGVISVTDRGITIQDYKDPKLNEKECHYIGISFFLEWKKKNNRSHEDASKIKILDASLKKGQDSIILILLSDGSVLSAEISYLPGIGFYFSKELSQSFDVGGGKTFEMSTGICDSIGKVDLNDPNHSVAWGKILGDAVYTLIADNVSGSPKNILYVSHDAAHTFTADTTGMQGDEPFIITLDANQKLYVGGRKGLYIQDSNSFTWTKNNYPNVPSYYKPKSLFIASNNYIYTGIGGDYTGSGNTYLSKDNGANWTDISSTFNNTFVQEFCEDAYGNIYAIAEGKTRIYKSSDKGANWSVISKPIDNQSMLLKTAPIYQSIAADSSLVTGTVFGVFKSTDQGSTWSEHPTNIAANTINGIETNSKNEWIVSLNSGIYNMAKHDSVWSKKYPSNAFSNVRKLYKDKNKNIYTVADHDIYNSLMMPLKSTDDGMTYTPDSNGIGNYDNTITQCYWVDNDGNQYMGTTQKKIVSKLVSSNSWSDDVNGLPSTGYVYAIANNATKVFAAITGPSSIYSRDISATNWVQETNGLSGEDVWILTKDSKNNIYGATGSTGHVLKYNNGNWTALNRPNGNWNSSSGLNALAIDDSGTIFAAYNNYSSTPVYKLFYTKDDGNTWIDAGFDILVSQLKSFGDTTIIVTANGVFYITRHGLIVAKEVVNAMSSPITYSPINIYPNPSKNNIQIEINAIQKEQVKASCISLNGQTVYNKNYTLLEGKNNLNIDISDLAPGIYIYQLQGKDCIYTGRFAKQ